MSYCSQGDKEQVVPECTRQAGAAIDVWVQNGVFTVGASQEAAFTAIQLVEDGTLNRALVWR